MLKIMSSSGASLQLKTSMMPGSINTHPEADVTSARLQNHEAEHINQSPRPRTEPLLQRKQQTSAVGRQTNQRQEF
jgi:hypothetical protein